MREENNSWPGNVVITGSESGLGAQLAARLTDSGWSVFRVDQKLGSDVQRPDEALKASGLDEQDSVQLLINAAGVNDINWAEYVTTASWNKIMDVNARAQFFMAQALSRQLHNSNGTVLNVVSNAAHMPMRCSAAYNASKAAALMITRQLAREWSPTVTVFSVSPNKMKGTEMSEFIDRRAAEVRGWSASQAHDYQLAGLLAGEETPVELVGEFIAFLLESKDRHRYLTGCDIPYGA